MPLVSVIIATYNRASYLPASVASVLGQTFGDFELIVVDDGSTDATAQVLEPFLGHLRYVYQKNAERGAARNHGLRLANGKYIAFLDSDDMWTPTKLEKEVELIRQCPDVGLAYSDAIYVDQRGRPCGRVGSREHEGDALERMAQGNFVSIGAHLVDREWFLAAGAFSEDRLLSGSEDWEAWARLAADVRFAHVTNVGLLYRQHEGNSATNAQGMERSMLHACKLIFGNEKLRPRIAHLERRTRATVHLILANLHLANGSRAAAQRHLSAARAQSPDVVSDQRYVQVQMRLVLGWQLITNLRTLKRWVSRTMSGTTTECRAR